MVFRNMPSRKVISRKHKLTPTSTVNSGESLSESFTSFFFSSSLGANITRLFLEAELVGADLSIPCGVFATIGVLRFEGVLRKDGVFVMSDRGHTSAFNRYKH